MMCIFLKVITYNKTILTDALNDMKTALNKETHNALSSCWGLLEKVCDHCSEPLDCSQCLLLLTASYLYALHYRVNYGSGRILIYYNESCAAHQPYLHNCAISSAVIEVTRFSSSSCLFEFSQSTLFCS